MRRLVLLLAAIALTVGSSCIVDPTLLVLDFARSGNYYVDDAARDAVHQFLKYKIDVTEDSTGTLSVLWKSLNPWMQTFHYALDMQICQHDKCGYGTGGSPANPEEVGIPESYYLHYAETTQIRLRPIYGVPADYGAPDPWIVTIPGCPDGTPATRACRLQSWGWNDTAFFFDQGNPDFRRWMAARLLRGASASSADGVFLDAHGPEFRSIYMASTDVLSGGMIREYGLRATDPALAAPYHADLVDSMKQERATLNAAGKFLMVNCASWTLDARCTDEALAAGGVHTEMLFTPTMSADQLDQMAQLVDQLTQQSFGMVDLYGSACSWGGSVYSSPGNFSSARARYHYWRFAAYLLVRENASAPGHAFFDPTLCYSDPWGQTPDFDPTRPGAYDDYQSEWLGAYRSFGYPKGPAVTLAQGDSPPGTCAQSWGRSYTVLKRSYDDGIVLVRPRDSWDCDNYGDATAVTVPLGGTYRLRRDDGTLGSPITTIALRNGEAAILELP